MKRFYLTPIILLILSLTLVIGCSDKKPVKKVQVKEVKSAPNTKVTDSLAVVKKASEVKKIVKKEATYKNPYHIIIGSFNDRENATSLMNAYKSKGYNAHLVTRIDNQLTSVSIASYPDIHKAYNEMYRLQDETDINAWVLFQEKK